MTGYYALCLTCRTRTLHEITGDEKYIDDSMHRTVECRDCSTRAVETWEYVGAEGEGACVPN